MSKPIVVMLWGAPASGKTTIASGLKPRLEQEYGLPVCHLSPDALNQAIVGDRFLASIREALYRGAMAMLEAMLNSQHLVLLDGTFLSRDLRGRVAKLAQTRGAALISVHITCTYPSRAARNAARPDSSRVRPEWMRKAHYQALAARAEADLIIDSDRCDADQAVESVLTYLVHRLELSEGVYHGHWDLAQGVV